MVICLERSADLHMAQLMPVALTVSCFSKIQIGFTFLVPAHPGSPAHRAVNRACVCVSQSTFVSYTENFTEARCDMEMEGGTLSTAAEPENVKLCTSVVSYGGRMRDIHGVYGRRELLSLYSNALAPSHDV